MTIESDLQQQLGRKVDSVEPIATGHSGFTYFVDAEGERYVLRLPPPGARIAGPADVVRQGRIMAALHDAGLPTPAIPAMSAEPVIDGRPFVLMEAIDGERIETVGRGHSARDIATSPVAVLHRLQAVAVEQTGIGGEDPVGLPAEMMRWAWLMQRAPEELTTRAGELGGLLARAVPDEHPPTLVHGDYHYGNFLFRGPEVVAVLDWEIAQIGQPLLDLGALAVVVGRHPGEWPAAPEGELFELYGVNGGEMRWYVAMSLYKYAAIFGYNLMLHRRGKRPDLMYEGLTGTITTMIDQGIKLLS